ncbi:hypothetical protein BV22DRAFT_1023044, partial [Leucogyrophana mollusca]
RGLCVLARTCRAFQEMALDLLWETLNSVGPLVQCLPRDVWKRAESEMYVHSECVDYSPLMEMFVCRPLKVILRS